MSHMRLAAVMLTVLACSSPGPAAAHETARSGPYSLELVDESGRALPAFHHRGRTYVLGARGARYLLRIRNETGGRIEVVASVDGRDVVDGKPASVSRPGYLVPPWGQVIIDGFRLSHDSVAAFRFSSVDRSYAAQMGSARDVGVIGVAVFTEAPPPEVACESPGPARRGDKDAPAPAAGAPPSDGLSSAEAGSRGRKERPGLGTGFGEQHESHVVEVAFERASSAPSAMLSLRYDDRTGLVALGIDVDGRRVSSDRWLRETAEPFRSDGFAEPPLGWQGR